MELFSKEFLETAAAVKQTSLNPLCFECGLFKKVNSPKMKWTGKGKKEILIIGEAPGTIDDKEGRQFLGDSGNLLRKYLTKVDIDLEKDCWKINAVNCKPTDGIKNRKPTKSEISYCRPLVEKAIKELQPNFIWAFGTAALQSLFSDDFDNITIDQFRGLCIPDSKYQTYILPMYSPSFMLQKEKNDNLKSVYLKDLKHAVKCLDKKPCHSVDLRALDIEIILDFDKIISILNEIIEKEPKYFFFDYETTGLKPFYPNHKIVLMSFAIDSKKAYSFPFNHTNIFTEKEKEEIKKRWIQILINPNIKKIAHNIQFEDLWSRVILGKRPKNWYWCTQLTIRCYDNRRKGSGLKYSVYREFGIRPYNKSVESYLNGNPYNKVEKIPLKELLEYGAYDSLFGMMLFEKQRKDHPELIKHEGRKLLTQSAIAFSKMTETGMLVDEKYYHSEIKRLKKRMENIHEWLMDSDEAKAFEKKFKRKLSISSNPDLGNLFYKVMNYPKIFTNEKEENFAVDKAALEKIDSKFVKKLFEWRKLEKITSTYLKGFLDVAIGNKIHPSFSHNVAISLRSESRDPNFQNIPARDEEAKSIVRKGLKALPGYKFMEGDYSGIEVYTGCFYHKDKNMITYLTDPSTDMHRDTAADIWILKKDQVIKAIRHSGKNGWVFPVFYGSYFRSCAKNLWYNFMNTKEMNLADGTPMKDHLASKGIKTYAQFEGHCEAVEKIFWGTRFFEYDQWRKDINKFYRKHGYVETFFGFKMTAPMEEKEVSNYPIQGTAHHILIWTLNRITQEQERRKWKSKLCGNVHDSGCMHVWPDEEEEVIKVVSDIATNQVREEHPWIFLPLSFEIEMTDINGSWFDKKKIGGSK